MCRLKSACLIAVNMMNLNEYDFDVQFYNTATNIDTQCIDLLFVNQGTNTAFVRGFPLTQGQSLPINGNVGEVIRKTVNIYFSPAGVDNNLMVVRRFYLND